MKELSIEEKAKRYDEAIKVAKSNYETIVQIDKECTFAKEGIVNTFHHMFPELKEEINDERIKDAAIEFVGQNKSFNYRLGISKEEVIAWLEKQSEQKSADKKELKKIEQMPITMSLDEAIEHCKEKSCGNNACALEHKQLGKWLTELKELKEQKSAWSEEDEKIIIQIGDTVGDYFPTPVADKIKSWLKDLKNRVQLKQEWKQENIGDLTDFEIAMMHIGNSFFGQNAGLDPNDTNAIKEQANILLGLIPKQEWSEKDGWYLESIISNFVYLKDKANDNIIKHIFQNKIDWLKSLRPQKHWKPSDRELGAILAAIGDERQKGSDVTKELLNIYQQLKKLREE